jgi:hypothetical protein
MFENVNVNYGVKALSGVYVLYSSGKHFVIAAAVFADLGRQAPRKLGVWLQTDPASLSTRIQELRVGSDPGANFENVSF